MPAAAKPRPSALRLYGSRRTRTAVGVAAAAALACAVAIPFVFEWPMAGPAATGGLLGCAMVLAVLFTRIRPPARECAFCGQTRADGNLLVTGPHVAVCEGCSALSMAVAATLLERQGKDEEWLRLVVEALPPKCPREISRPMLEALLRGTAEPSLLRQVARTAGKLHNHPLAVELLQRIPEAERTAGDWHNLGFALGENGHDAEALAAASKALAMDDGTLRPWCLDNTVWFAVRLERHPSNEQKAHWLADLEEAKRLLTTQHPLGWEDVWQGCLGTEAALYHATGDNTRALQALTAAEKVAPLSGYQLLIRARVLASSGLSTRAREEAERALQSLHPQSHKADEARELLAALP